MIKDSTFATLDPAEIEQVVLDLEDEIFKKHPEADVYYKKRIGDICENIKLLRDYKDISDLMAIKRALSYGKLL